MKKKDTIIPLSKSVTKLAYRVKGTLMWLERRGDPINKEVIKQITIIQIKVMFPFIKPNMIFPIFKKVYKKLARMGVIKLK